MPKKKKSKVGVQERSGQSHGARRKVRVDIRKRVASLAAASKEAARPENELLLKSVKHENENFVKNVLYARDAVEDTKHLGLAGRIATQQAKSLHTVYSSIDVTSLQRSLKKRFRGQDGLDWGALGKTVGSLWRSAPACRFFKGRLNAQKKVRRKQRRRSGKDAAAETVRPETLKTKVTEDGATSKRDVQLRMFLAKLNRTTPKIRMSDGKMHRRMPMFETLIDPDSFSKTVEHMFYYAFLVKDGVGSIELDEDGRPAISISADFLGAEATAEDKARYKELEESKPSEPEQNVVSIDMDQWLDMRRVIRNEAAVLPDFDAADSGDKPHDLRVALGAGAPTAAPADDAAAAAAIPLFDDVDDEESDGNPGAGAPVAKGKGKGRPRKRQRT